MKKICLTVVLVCVWGNAGHALDSEQQRGKALLGTLCERCHAVGPRGQCAHADAPPFRTLGEPKLYDTDFAARLREGLSSIHPDMPTFRFSREDAEAAVNYLKSIQAHKEPN